MSDLEQTPPKSDGWTFNKHSNKQTNKVESRNRVLIFFHAGPLINEIQATLTDNQKQDMQTQDDFCKNKFMPEATAIKIQGPI